jgi:V8-like Glu-specific endopeptidase
VSLVSSKHVITAAHCIERPNEPHLYTIMLGRHNIADGRERNFQSRKVTRLEVHFEYESRRERADADIAVMKMRSAVQFDKFVQPVCLPTATIYLDDKPAVTVGFGRNNRTHEHNTFPRKILVGALHKSNCRFALKDENRNEEERGFCVGGYEEPLCRGE